jgi:hypothetical protein
MGGTSEEGFLRSKATDLPEVQAGLPEVGDFPGKGKSFWFIGLRIALVGFIVLFLGEMVGLWLFPQDEVPDSQYRIVGFVTAAALIATYWIAQKKRSLCREVERVRQRRIEAEVEADRIRRRIQRSMESIPPLGHL